jgi:ribose transport system permease protein
VLAKSRWGYETYATGGNELAATYAGIPTAGCASAATSLLAMRHARGLDGGRQDKGTTSQAGLRRELIVIAAVIVGGASILGGRGRMIGSVLGADHGGADRQGAARGRADHPHHQGRRRGHGRCRPCRSCRPARFRPFLGLILLIAVLIEPWLIRRNVIPRSGRGSRGQPLPPVLDAGGIAIVGVQTKATVADTTYDSGPLARLFTRRDTAAVIIAAILWGIGLYLRPDFWASLDNTFNLMLAFTEVGLLAVGLTYVIANGDIDLSVGSVLALSGATAAFFMKQLGYDPLTAVFLALMAGAAAGCVNAFLTVNLRLPAFVATLGMFYMARGIGAWLVAGRQLSGFPEEFNLVGRKLIEALRYLGIAPEPGSLFFSIAAALSVAVRFSWSSSGHPRRHLPRLHGLGPAGLRYRRQHPRRPICRHQLPTASVSSASSSPASAPPSRASSISPSCAPLTPRRPVA